MVKRVPHSGSSIMSWHGDESSFAVPGWSQAELYAIGTLSLNDVDGIVPVGCPE